MKTVKNNKRERLLVTTIEREIIIAGLQHLGEFYTSREFQQEYRVTDLIKKLKQP